MGVLWFLWFFFCSCHLHLCCRILLNELLLCALWNTGRLRKRFFVDFSLCTFLDSKHCSANFQLRHIAVQ